MEWHIQHDRSLLEDPSLSGSKHLGQSTANSGIDTRNSGIFHPSQGCKNSSTLLSIEEF